MAADASPLYRAHFENNTKREVRVLRDEAGHLRVSVAGFDSPLEFAVNGGGVTMCAVTLRQRSATARLDLILPIPDPRGRCRMLPGSISFRSEPPAVTSRKTTLVRVEGNDRELRRTAMRLYGEIRE